MSICFCEVLKIHFIKNKFYLRRSVTMENFMKIVVIIFLMSLEVKARKETSSTEVIAQDVYELVTLKPGAPPVQRRTSVKYNKEPYTLTFSEIEKKSSEQELALNYGLLIKDDLDLSKTNYTGCFTTKELNSYEKFTMVRIVYFKPNMIKSAEISKTDLNTLR